MMRGCGTWSAYVELVPDGRRFSSRWDQPRIDNMMVGDMITDSHAATYQVLFCERQTLNNSIAVVCRPVE